MTLRYAFYGDDFTGSTDVLEQLAEGGVNAALYLHEPTAELRGRFPGVEAIGIAGESRSRSPDWMDENLPSAFAALQGAGVVHYKTCSTFDSSPQTGSIGRALDIGLDLFGSPAVIVVGAPYMGRYVAFGNLFARAGDDVVYRIDRHPTMSRHPVTPMREADLIRHLADQTERRIERISLDRIKSGVAGATFDEVGPKADAVLFDGVDLDDLEKTGELLLDRNVRFAVGSSGLTRALVLAWRKRGLVTEDIATGAADEVERLLVISGSCSPVTAIQIARSAELGFQTEKVDVTALLRGEASEERRLTDAALATLKSGHSFVIHSAEGPLDQSLSPAGERLGEALGRIARTVIRRSGLRRILFAGGDTSSHGVAQLGVDALTWAAPIEPGAPLVRSHAEDPSIDGLEMVLKGGQIGGDDFFDRVRRGTPPG